MYNVINTKSSDGSELNVIYDNNLHIFILTVEKNGQALSGEVYASHEPLFSVDTADQSAIFQLAENLAKQLDQNLYS